MYLKSRLSSFMFTWIFILFFHLTVFGIQDSLKTYNLNEITVTAQRIEKPLLDVGRSVSVIPSDEIRSNLFLSPAELISNYEGIFITGNYQTPGSLQGIYMRGATPNQTVVLVDGIRITDPSSVDNAIDLSELSFSNISRIEMIRGSHSTLYGSSAIGGVINILTDKNRAPGLNTDVFLRGGTFGKGTDEFSQNVMLNYTTKEGFYLTGEVFNSKVNGLDATIDTITSPGVYKTNDKDGFRKLDLTGKIGYATNKLDMYFSYKRTDQKSDVDAGAFDDDDNYTIGFKRDLLSLGVEYKLADNISAKLQSGFTAMKRDAVNDSSIIDFAGNYDQSFSETNYEGSVLTSDLQVNFKFDNMNLIAGGGYYKETMNTRSYVYSNSAWGAYESLQDLDSLDLNTSLTNLFVYLDMNGKIIDKSLSDFNLALGSRINSHSKFGSYITYEINPSFKIGKSGLVYASYATGFNAPPLYRLFSPNSNYMSSITRGNENLKPEESYSLEAGIKYEFDESAAITISGYSTKVDNNIEYVYLWDKNIAINDLGNDWMRDDSRGDTYINIGTMSTRGIEAAIDIKVADNIFVSGNISIMDGKLEYKPEDIDTEQTQGNHVQLYSNGAFMNASTENDTLVRRSNTANLGITYQPIDVLSLRLNMHYIGKRDDVYYNDSLGPWGALGKIPVSDFMLFDISAKYSFNNNLSATISIKNILDKNYYELRGYRTRGRGMYMGIRYSL